jgi:hypothetical protein
VEEKASMATRKEIITRIRLKYKKATKKGRGAILDNLGTTTGLSRSRIKHLLSIKPWMINKPQKPRPGRAPKYGGVIKEALIRVWMFMDNSCGKRLTAGMDDMLDAMIRYGEISYDKDTVALLREMSSSTADRLLKRAKEEMRFKGISTTKPGTLLKKNIPIRLGDEWDDAQPGYVEVDLVAHCGDTASGDYLNTLDMTDICTGWTETQTAVNKAQVHVHKAIKDCAGRMPFSLRGLDSDNGSEFINGHLFRYCQQNDICFTRSRPYKKNDNCHVEQKNWHVVRRNIGYDRYEGGWAVEVMNRYYSKLRLYTNFFLPQVKLILKRREGGHIYKRYEKPMTPYRRVLQSEHITAEVKADLTKVFDSINPIQLKREMAELLEKLRELRVPTERASISYRKIANTNNRKKEVVSVLF